MRSSVAFCLSALFLAFSTTYSQADFLLNCHLMKPGDPLYRQHCKPELQVVRIQCRDRDLCLVLKKRLAMSAMKAAESKASTVGNSPTGATRAQATRLAVEVSAL